MNALLSFGEVDETAANCLYLVEKYAALYTRAGGGKLSGESRRSNLTSHDEAEICRLYVETRSTQLVSGRTGWSLGAVTRALARNGVALNPPGGAIGNKNARRNPAYAEALAEYFATPAEDRKGLIAGLARKHDVEYTNLWTKIRGTRPAHKTETLE